MSGWREGIIPRYRVVTALVVGLAVLTCLPAMAGESGRNLQPLRRSTAHRLLLIYLDKEGIEGKIGTIKRTEDGWKFLVKRYFGETPRTFYVDRETHEIEED